MFAGKLEYKDLEVLRLDLSVDHQAFQITTPPWTEIWHLRTVHANWSFRVERLMGPNGHQVMLYNTAGPEGSEAYLEIIGQKERTRR